VSLRQRFKNISIKHKLVIIIMLTSTLVLALASSAFLINDLITFRNSMVHDLKTLARIIGSNSAAALVFNDTTAAEETLSELQSKPHIVAASIYTKNGNMLARYARPNASFKPIVPGGEEVVFKNGQVFVMQTILLNREIVGNVAIQYDLDEMYSRVLHYGGIATMIMLLASLVAFVLSSRLQRLISDPILKLADTAHTISREKRYSLRAKKHGQDEIGTLIDGFNEMLDQIQERDAKLEQQRDDLEVQVAQRTSELRTANEELRAEMDERIETEKALASEKERLAVTLRSIVDGVIATDLQGNIVLINKSAEEMAGWVQEEALGKHLDDVFIIVDPHTHEPSRNTVREILKSGDVVAYIDHVVLTSTGALRIIAHNGAPIRDKNGTIIGVIIAFRDITEKQKMEEELLRARRLDSIGILAGGIAHDFNNLLTAILGNVSLAKLYVDRNEKAFGRLVDAEKASLRAKDLTQQLLTFSKGGAPVKRTASITDLLVDSASFGLSGSNVKCEFDLPEGLWPVDVDEGQMSQVINNLIINADHAMPAGGVITVRAENIVVGTDNALFLTAGKYVKISVQDQGIGIAEANLQRIFDPYFTTKTKGSGLGLATCYSIIKRHDGLIIVESELGKGTIFHMYLPASEKQPTGSKGAEKREQTSSGRGRILIMDDEESVREILSNMLQHLGYAVECAGDGSEAIASYRKSLLAGNAFGAVIMDLTIPGGMGGKETMQRLKELDPQVRGIVSSGYSNDPVMANFRAHGFSGVVTKPYLVEELSQTLENVVRN
jgi:PAS domain S-box-containing protein